MPTFPGEIGLVVLRATQGWEDCWSSRWLGLQLSSAPHMAKGKGLQELEPKTSGRPKVPHPCPEQTFSRKPAYRAEIVCEIFLAKFSWKGPPPKPDEKQQCIKSIALSCCALSIVKLQGRWFVVRWDPPFLHHTAVRAKTILSSKSYCTATGHPATHFS